MELITDRYQFHFQVKMYPINIGGAESSVFFFVEIGFFPRELLLEGRNASKAYIWSENIFSGSSDFKFTIITFVIATI